ncbi:MAG: aldehyde dehydrogenase family protein [Marinicaulis sp.]|nr:aldehyde dehydrogenase family protein [Marinicaulis sp.]
MRDYTQFYIGGEWVAPSGSETMDVINPASEQKAGAIALGQAADIDCAVEAASAAFPAFARTSRQDRVELLNNVAAEYQKRLSDMADAITEEMGAPSWMANKMQAPVGLGHLMTASKILADYQFEEPRGAMMIAKEPIGVCGFITPWNWPSNQIAAKVAPALATGCTMVLKPSEIAPFSAYLWAEIIDAAGVPAGVFNLVNGEGPVAGAALASHPKVDMVSFTGSTRGGVAVAQNAAPTVKRVHQELGGKSPNIILDDADFERAVAGGVKQVMLNTGQSCNAPTRMLVPAARLEEANGIAAAAAAKTTVGDPSEEVAMGPLVSKAQWEKVQGLIEKGIEEGARVIAGGAGKPDGLNQGYYAKPTVFSDVNNDMIIAREEIFGPVLSIIPYNSEEEAIAIANDTEYGLAAYVQGSDIERIRNVASQLRAGQVTINGANGGMMAPFGGYKQSGNGREWGDLAFDEFLEVKAVIGYEAE